MRLFDEVGECGREARVVVRDGHAELLCGVTTYQVPPVNSFSINGPLMPVQEPHHRSIRQCLWQLDRPGSAQ